MTRKPVLMVCVLVFLSVSVSSSSAQDENRFGVGVDVQNQSFELLSFTTTGASPFFTLAHTSLTPSFLLSFRPTPSFFIEPSFGIHRSSDEETDTDVSPNLTSKETTRDIKLGLGVLFLTSPGSFVSPFLHGAFDIHFLNYKDEDDVTFPTPGTNTFEISATAIAVAGGVGGIITIEESVFITLEGRLLYARVGDSDQSESGPGSAGFEDTTDTESSVWSTDMTVGLRVLFY